MISISLIPIKNDGRFVGLFRGLLWASSDVDKRGSSYCSSLFSAVMTAAGGAAVSVAVLRTITVTSERCRCAV